MPSDDGPKAMSGDGAYPPGIRVVYCAESRSLAVIEMLANIKQPAFLGDQAWVFIPIELVEKPARVPESWRGTPYGTASQAFGAEWVQAQRSVALRVPSVVVLGEFNCLLNPTHPDYKRIRIGRPEPFAFDPRITE